MNVAAKEGTPPTHCNTLRLALAVILLLGAALQLWMWWRSVWVYWDQAALFGMALEFLHSGELSGLGKEMTGDLRGPAGLLQLLVGLPLFLWPKTHASSLVVVLFHFAAIALLVHAVAKLAGLRLATFFAAIYWLAPWRLYLGGFVWEPSYLFLPAALHLWTCASLIPGTEELSRQRRLWPSILLGIAVATAPQLHPSGVILLTLTAILGLRRTIRAHLVGLATGIAIGCLPALPALSALAHTNRVAADWSQMSWLPISTAIKGLTYWLRLPSPDIGGRLLDTVFCGSAESGFGLTGGGLSCTALWLLLTASRGLAILCLVANVWCILPKHRQALGTNVRWLNDYALSALAALLLTVMMSPFNIQGWYTVAVLHAACIPVATWAAHQSRRRAPWYLAAGTLFLLARLIVVIVLATGHPMYVRPSDSDLPGRMQTIDLQPLIRDPGPLGDA